HARRPVDLREADLRAARHLPVAGFSTQLSDDLVNLPQSRRAHRLAVREAAAVSVDRQLAVDARCAAGVELRLFAVLAQPALREVDQLGARLGVLELRNVDVCR